VFRSQRLLVEVDGVAWHLSPERWARDVERHTRLEAAGWTVLRYPAARVLRDPFGVAAEIARVVGGRRAA
jgi:very-short-patch-repair endonuclease